MSTTSNPQKKWPLEGKTELHTHSVASDGALTPTALADLCHQAQVTLWSLTDHDTCDGCREAAVAARARGIFFVPGIEISASDQGRSVHVLGYGFDPDDPALAGYMTRMDGARRARMIAMIACANALGLSVGLEEVEALSETGVMGRPHLARALLNHGYVEDIQEAFDLYLSDGKPAFVNMEQVSVPEAIEIITRAGGLSILAHPAHYRLAEELEGWVEAGLHGLEVRHPSHLLEDEQRLISLADRYGLLKTASSDFHRPSDDASRALGRVNFPPLWRDAFLEALGS